MKYIKLFDTHSQYEDYAGGGGMLRPNVSHCISENEVHYNPIPHDYSKDYLTFVALENNTSFRFTDRLPNYQLSYSLDNGSTWTVLEGDNTVTINTDEKILWKGELIPTRIEIDPSNIGVFTSTKHFNAMGNIMSLAYSDNFVENNTLPENTDFFKKLFKESYVVDAGNLVLPATVLANECYQYMFEDCTSLTVAPELPATTLAERCYALMFYGCASLVTAPELPATTLTKSCYNNMFSGCINLTTAPELPATRLAQDCYQAMFQACSSLTTAPVLPAGTLASYCYQYMFRDCTNLVNAPELSATTLASNCYGYMFYGCTKLNSITCLATDISATNCTNNWVSGVASSGTFTKAASMSSWTRGAKGIPTGWTVQTATT